MGGMEQNGGRTNNQSTPVVAAIGFLSACSVIIIWRNVLVLFQHTFLFLFWFCFFPYDSILFVDVLSSSVFVQDVRREERSFSIAIGWVK